MAVPIMMGKTSLMARILHQGTLQGYKTVVSVTYPVRLESPQVFKLYGTGLIHLHENEVVPSCELYRQYFLDRPKSRVEHRS